MSDDFFTLTQVKERGWSDRLILEILGSPDTTRKNPFYRSGPLIKLFMMDRVVSAEASEAFIAYQSKRAAMSARSKTTAQRKRQELLADIENMPVSIKRKPSETVIKEAIRNWEDRGYERDDYRDGSNADDATKRRWAVNYIRHNLCQYDESLEGVAGKIGVSEAVTAIRRKVYAKIAEAYPEFSGECRRQMEQREDASAT